MTDQIKIKLYIDTGFAGCSHIDYMDVDREEWEAMTEDEQQEWLDDAARTHMGNHIDYGAFVVKGEDE